MDDVVIRPLAGHEEFAACVALQRETWGETFSEEVPPALLMAAQRLGGVASGAFDRDGRLVGFVFGITGWEDGRPVHWSDMLAVRRERRGRGLGTLLKRHQRERLLPLGVERVYWTFDPLEARNAHINFGRLGVEAREYRRDMYGETASPLHALGTDRLVVVWAIASERVARRLEGHETSPTREAVEGAPLVHRPRETPAGLRPGVPAPPPDAPSVRIPVPSDIQSLAAGDAALGREWRAATREAFEEWFGRGYRATELLREPAWASYLLVAGTAGA